VRTRAGIAKLAGFVFLSSACMAACGDDDEEVVTSDLACLSSPERTRAFTFCPDGPDLAAKVNPLIGTASSGNTTPSVRVPHGMMKVGPNTKNSSGSVDAYQWESDRIEGFTHDNLSGPGGSNNGYSQILLLPLVGDLNGTDPGSTFSHSKESAAVDRYAVDLDDYGVKVELTATAHAAIHRYTFPKSDAAKLFVDAGHSLGKSTGGHVEIVGDHTLTGFGEYNVHPALGVLVKSEPETGHATTYFVVELSVPFSSFGTTVTKVDGEVTVTEGQRETDGVSRGAYAGFATSAGDIVEARVGISRISVEQARLNLETELSGKTFEDVRDEARSKWNCLLRRVSVEGGTEAQQTSFYSALFQTLTQPTDYTEVGGRFFSATAGDGRVRSWKNRGYYLDDWCAWDTFRTSRPLGTLVEPERVDDIVASYLEIFREGGWLPKCTWNASGYSRVMIGNHAVSIIADAMTKGAACFDRDLAWRAVQKSATEDDTTNLIPGLCGFTNLGTPPDYLKLGYVPHECDTDQSVSMTLEYAYDDWCTAKIAHVLGRPEAEASYAKRSEGFRNHWDASVGFMRPKHEDGSWVSPFDPTTDSISNGFTEANAWIYTWFVPQNVPALVELVGGPDAFVQKLDAFFAEYFDPSNEPSFHTPYLYNWAGRPDKAQERVHDVLTQRFDATPDGLPGNDDSGATSAWYVLSAMGIYPVAPGDGVYQLVTPLFSKVTLQQSAAPPFVIDVKGAGPGQIYIQSARLNGEPVNAPELHHADIVKGGTLELTVGAAPSTWGSTSP